MEEVGIGGFNLIGTGEKIKSGSISVDMHDSVNFEEVLIMITVNIRYTGNNGSAWNFADEMIASGTVAAIRAEKGNVG